MNGWVEVWGAHTDCPLRGYVNDISLDGISFHIKESIAPGETLVFALYFFGEGQFEFVRALGARVVACSKADKSFQIRARFLEAITQENEPVLFAYLMSEKKPIDFGYKFGYSLRQDPNSILGTSHVIP